MRNKCANVHRSLRHEMNEKRAAYVNAPRSLSHEAKKASYTCYTPRSLVIRRKKRATQVINLDL